MHILKVYLGTPTVFSTNYLKIIKWRLILTQMVSGVKFILETIRQFGICFFFIIENVNDPNQASVAAGPSSSSSASASQIASFQSKSDRIFSKLNKDIENLEAYYKKSLQRYTACLLALSNMFTPLEEEKVVIKVKSSEIIEFLKRLYMFDFKKLIKNSRMNAESRLLSKIMSEILNITMEFSKNFFNTLETNLLPYGENISFMLANFGYNITENFLSGSIAVYYDCLKCWMTSNGPSCGFFKYSSSFINTLLECVKPFKNNLVSVRNLFL